MRYIVCVNYFRYNFQKPLMVGATQTCAKPFPCRVACGDARSEVDPYDVVAGLVQPQRLMLEAVPGRLHAFAGQHTECRTSEAQLARIRMPSDASIELHMSPVGATTCSDDALCSESHAKHRYLGARLSTPKANKSPQPSSLAALPMPAAPLAELCLLSPRSL